MQTRTRVVARRGPNRLQIVLAAAWMILSLAFGGLMTAGASADGDPVVTGISTTAQP